jgi:amino-acid N-acetyltransferase
VNVPAITAPNNVIIPIQLLGRQFVLGRNIDEAQGEAASARKDLPQLTFSYDMLGEGARTEHDAERYLAAWPEPELPSDRGFYLRHCVKACRAGVDRSHILPFAVDGALLQEVYTHDGIGTMVVDEKLESLREATEEDVGGILQVIEPFEKDGTLVKRDRTEIERDIGNYTIIEHDGVIFACAALYPFAAEKMAEMACLTVNPEVQTQGDGERLLKYVENRARAAGYTKLFVLTTRTAHWFLKRGFVNATVDALPKDRQHMYNWQRKSLVLIKHL